MRSQRFADKQSLGRELLLAVGGTAVVVGTLMLGIVDPSLLRAQSPAPDWHTTAGVKMVFDVASIKPGEPGKFIPPNFNWDPEDSTIPPGGRFSADFPLERYIEFAYKLLQTREQRQTMLAHLPKWIATDPYVIEAKATGNPSKDQMRLMVQALLADRFKLAVHFETRVVPVFALVLVKPGEMGPKIRLHADPPCDNPVTPPAGGRDGGAADVFPRICGDIQARPMPNHMVLLGSRNTTMQLIATYLPQVEDLGRPVVDQTGLSGKFDFTLEWTPESNNVLSSGAGGQLDTQGPTFLEALKEQLGLTLKQTKAPVDVLVVDHVEEPSQN